jgi:hypothetical protein
MKKDSNVHLVQNIRALNNQSYTEKDISECIGEIGYSVGTIFSMINLTAGICLMASSSEIFIKRRANRIYISPLCRLQLRDHILISDFSIELDMPINH